jgi:hypothetical protein
MLYDISILRLPLSSPRCSVEQWLQLSPVCPTCRASVAPMPRSSARHTLISLFFGKLSVVSRSCCTCGLGGGVAAARRAGGEKKVGEMVLCSLVGVFLPSSPCFLTTFDRCSQRWICGQCGVGGRSARAFAVWPGRRGLERDCDWRRRDARVSVRFLLAFVLQATLKISFPDRLPFAVMPSSW